MVDLAEATAPPQERGRRTVWLLLGGSLLLVVQGPGGEVGVPAMPFELERPEELPDEKPDVVGVCVRRDGNSLFLGTGTFVKVEMGPDGATDVDYDGPEVEVVVTRDAEIYQECIEVQEDTVKQTLGPGSLEDIGQGSSVQVWGEKRGDRIVVHIVVYQLWVEQPVQP